MAREKCTTALLRHPTGFDSLGRCVAADMIAVITDAPEFVMNQVWIHLYCTFYKCHYDRIARKKDKIASQEIKLSKS